MFHLLMEICAGLARSVNAVQKPVVPVAAQLPQYTIVDLGDNGFRVNGIAQQGTPFGTYMPITIRKVASHACLRNGLGISDLNPADKTQSSVLAGAYIDTLVGYTRDTTGNEVAAEWTTIIPGQSPVYTSLGTLGGAISVAYGANQLHDVVGTSYISPSKSIHHAVLWTKGHMRDLGCYGGENSTALAINNLGIIVGFSEIKTHQIHAIKWSNNKIYDLGTFGGSKSVARAINNSGLIVCETKSMTNQSQTIVLIDGSKSTAIHPLDSNYSYATAVNSNGDVVGRAQVANLGYRPFLYTAGKSYDLNSLTNGNKSWVLTSATGINDAGMIVGDGMYNGVLHSFLLVPSTRPVLGTAKR